MSSMETNNYSNIVMKILRQHILFDIMIRRRLLKKAHNLANILGSFGNIQIQKFWWVPTSRIQSQLSTCPWCICNILMYILDKLFFHEQIATAQYNWQHISAHYAKLQLQSNTVNWLALCICEGQSEGPLLFSPNAHINAYERCSSRWYDL